MLIDVHDDGLNLILNISFVLMVLIGIVSVIPWPLRAGKNRWTLSLPLLAVGIYLIYEYAMPANWDIRLDLLLIWPGLLITMVLGLIRCIVVWRYRSRNQ